MDEQMVNAFSLIYSNRCIPNNLPVREVVNYFRNNSDQFAAIHGERKIVGIVCSEKLMFDIGSQFGWALYANKPISELMDPHPLIVKGADDIVSIFKAVVSRPEAKIYDDIVVVNERIFAGLISVRQVMRYHSEYLEQQLKIIEQQKKLLEKTISTHLLDKKVDPEIWSKKINEVVITAQRMEVLEEKCTSEPETNNNVPVTLQGCLDIFSVLDLIQLLVQGGKTGRLMLSDSSQSGVSSYALFVDHGSIVHAEGLGLSGKEALFEALRITSGNFVFYYNCLSDKITIHENPIFLLLESCRLQDEEAIPVNENKG
jgi:hypothetical protein